MSILTDGEPTAEEAQLQQELAGSRPEREQKPEPALVLHRLVYRRKFNLGNYSNEDIEAEVFVQPGDDPAVVFAALKRFVHACGPKMDKWGYVIGDEEAGEVP